MNTTGRLRRFGAHTHPLTGSPSAFELYIYYNLYFNLRVLYSRSRISKSSIRWNLQFDDLCMRVHHAQLYEIWLHVIEPFIMVRRFVFWCAWQWLKLLIGEIWLFRVVVVVVIVADGEPRFPHADVAACRPATKTRSRRQDNTTKTRRRHTHTKTPRERRTCHCKYSTQH